MSHKQTFAPQKAMSLYPNSDRKSGFPHKVMSALPPKPTCAVHAAMSALGQKQTCAMQLGSLLWATSGHRSVALGYS